MNKTEFIKALSIVRESIHRIDPYSLLEGGSPQDEFDSEINSVTTQLQRCNSGKDVAHAIARVLNSAFTEKHRPDDFEREGNIIYEVLIKHGLK